MFISTACKHTEKVNAGSCFFIDTTEFKECDLIFRKGRGMESQAVTMADGGALYSHVGLLIKENSSWKVLHAVPGEEAESGGRQILKKDPLELFTKSDRAVSIGIYRYDTTENALLKVKAEALRLFAKKVEFDHKYNIADTAKLYCTEYIWTVFKVVDVDLSEGRRHNYLLTKYPLIYPIDIIKNKKLKKIQ